MTIKSFCPLFSKSGQGQGVAAPCGIFKGKALKLPKIKSKFAYANFVNSGSNTLFFPSGSEQGKGKTKNNHSVIGNSSPE